MEENPLATGGFPVYIDKKSITAGAMDHVHTAAAVTDGEPGSREENLTQGVRQ